MQVKDAVYAEKCPECGEQNYYDVGDPVDITGVDTDGLICWNCKTSFLLDCLKDEGIDINDAYLELGRKRI